jgi:DNA-binding MarR family transcriptional regulator
MTVNEELTPKDLLIYATIKKYMNKDTLSCYPSLLTIVEKSGVSKPTILKAIDKLQTLGYIRVSKQGRSNLYTFSRHKKFEPFSYEFLDRTDISTEEKSLIIAEQQLMFKDKEGFGKISYTDLELSEKINMSYTSIVKHHKSLEKKGFLTTIKTNAKDSTTGLVINEKIFHLNELGQAIIWTLQKHEEDIQELKEKTESTSKDVNLLLKEIQRLNQRIDQMEEKPSNEIII